MWEFVLEMLDGLWAGVAMGAMGATNGQMAHRDALVVPDVDVCAVLDEDASGVDVLDGVEGRIAISIGDVDVAACMRERLQSRARCGVAYLRR